MNFSIVTLIIQSRIIVSIGPTKRRSQSGNTSILGGGIDSPCSSRASVAGSSCSEPWSTSSNGGTVDDSSNVSNLQGKYNLIYT